MKGTKMLFRPAAVLLSLAIGLAIFSGCGGGSKDGGTPKKPDDRTTTIVESRYQQASVNLDGIDDEEIWQNITSTTCYLESGVEFEMKSYYDDDNIYFLFRWLDLDPEPLSTIGKWYVRDDGSWNWDFSSDGFALVWDVMNMPNFPEEACTPLCHDQPDDLNRRYMGTDNPSDIQEFWNWNPGVTNAKGIMATYLWEALPPNVSIDDPGFNNRITWHHLPGEYGFYFNRLEDEIAPAEFVAGNEAPLYIIKDDPASGDAAIVKAFGMFEFGMYTLEVSRPRKPTNRDLYSFEVPDNGWSDILFAAAIFHNNERDSKKVMDQAATLRLVGKNIE